ncbi:hypothetical protein Mcup_1546 [Metallosphaera cuprina Ar-4]|uniref:Uncharacterized protein n=1 Tax=Metallosphaera cuprina (strain Ar-4) TaxID=1006006 RepID=F4FZF9_METCR|nr:hypothetical protein Mcup_1546 [Metallosphaera cuprina Ar-4]
MENLININLPSALNESFSKLTCFIGGNSLGRTKTGSDKIVNKD